MLPDVLKKIEAPASLVAGRSCPEASGHSIELIDPARGEVFARYSGAGKSVVDNAVAAAVAGGKAWRSLSASKRGEVLYKVAELVRRDQEHLALLEAATAGKPLRDTRGEVAKVAEMFAYYAGWCDKITGEVIPVATSHLNYTQPVPYGVVAQITPWNAPVFTAGWQLAPALAAGNAVILKPSELTPLSSLALANLLLEAGVPEQAVAVIAGDGLTAGNALVRHTEVRKVVFVGSVPAGCAVAGAAAEYPKPCVLELGGKSANIIFADACLERAAAGAAEAIFGSAGQSCVAGSRLLVERTTLPEFCERLRDIAEGIVLGDPLDTATQMGPINNQRQLQRIQAIVAASLEAGAELVTGGERASLSGLEQGYFYRPSIVIPAAPKDAIVTQEIFGPVVVVLPFDGEEEAVALANSSNFGLAGAVWSNDIARAHRVAGQLQAGTVWINSYKTINVMSPFGGFKQSGYGRSSGREGLWEYLQTRSVWTETASAPNFQFDYG